MYPQDCVLRVATIWFVSLSFAKLLKLNLDCEAKSSPFGTKVGLHELSQTLTVRLLITQYLYDQLCSNAVEVEA